MDLTKKNKLDTVTVFDLMNNNFYIPDYQRGYRWTEIEVKKLLEDLEDYFDRFSKDPKNNNFYCMQPLVVYFNKNENAWEVIDGQQRLTTMYLILKQQQMLLEQVYPGMELFELSYQSRPDSRQYLKNIDPDFKNNNIDYYHIFNSHNTIKKYFEKKPLETWNFINSILNVNNMMNKPMVKFIWYDVTEEIENGQISPEEKFSNLNIGKIGLTNAELIKALFLHNVSSNESEALRIATEWDNIEHALQDDNFWAFIYGKDDGKYATRIEFLFDIIQKKAPDETDDYFTFNKYTDKIKEDAVSRPTLDIVKELWRKVSDKYHLFNGWYADKKLYHIIGYLRYMKVMISDIEAIYYDSENEDMPAVYAKLKEKALASAQDVELRSLTYNDNHKKIFDLLTLFNILSIIDCEKESVRFSFSDFYGHSWDIEHVRSQTPKNLDGDSRKDWIACNLEYFSGVNYNETMQDENGKTIYKYHNNFDLYKKDITDAEHREAEIAGYTAEKICQELLDLFNAKTDVTETNIYKVLYGRVFGQDDLFEYEDNIGNLVLLDQGTNRGYKNAFFPVKRKWIHRREREGIYVLPCTRNVFSKNYSSMIFDLMNWNNHDAEAYMDEIERVLSNGKTEF